MRTAGRIKSLILSDGRLKSKIDPQVFLPDMTFQVKIGSAATVCGPLRFAWMRTAGQIKSLIVSDGRLKSSIDPQVFLPDMTFQVTVHARSLAPVPTCIRHARSLP